MTEFKDVVAETALNVRTLQRLCNLSLSDDADATIGPTVKDSELSEDFSEVRKHLFSAIEEAIGKLTELRNVVLNENKLSEEVANSVLAVTHIMGRADALASQMNNMIQLAAAAQQNSVLQTVASSAKKVFGVIKRWIMSISAQLWNLLCNYMTVREWKLQGTLGNGIWGFTSAGVEITFGP